MNKEYKHQKMQMKDSIYTFHLTEEIEKLSQTQAAQLSLKIIGLIVNKYIF